MFNFSKKTAILLTLAIVLGCFNISMLPLVAAVDAPSPIIASEMLDYDMGTSSSILMNTFVSQGKCAGFGWKSNWSGGIANFDTVLPKLGDGPFLLKNKYADGTPRVTFNNYRGDAHLFRELNQNIDFTADGEYYFSIVELPGASTNTQKQQADWQYQIGGQDLYFGYKYNSTLDRIVPQLGVNSVKTLSETTLPIPGYKKYQKYILNIKVHANGPEEFRYKVFDEASPEPAGWNIVYSAEVAAPVSRNYIGVRVTTNNAYTNVSYYDDFVIEKYAPLSTIDTALTGDLINGGYETVKASINELPAGMAKNHYLSVLDGKEVLSISNAVYKNAQGGILNNFSDIGDSVIAETQISNNFAIDKNVTAVMAIYQDEKLIGVSQKPYTITKKTYNNTVSVGFSPSDAALPVDYITGCKIKVFMLSGLDSLTPLNDVQEWSETVNNEPIAFKIFVSPNSQGGDGSFESPLSSPYEAAEMVKSKKLSGENSTIYEVNFRGGNYQINEPISLSGLSGEEGLPVIFRAYNDEKVNFVGGNTIDTSKFSAITDEIVLNRIDADLRDKIKQVNLSEFNINYIDGMPVLGHSTAYYKQLNIPYNDVNSVELVFDDELMTIARWPNSGYTNVGNVIDTGSVSFDWILNNTPRSEWDDPLRGMKFTLNDERITRWASATDMWLHGYWYWDWSDLTVKAKTIDTINKQIETLQHSPFGVRSGQRFYVYNLLEELDIPGEWFIDRNTNILYFYPPKNEGSISLITLSSPIINADSISNVIISKINFIGSRSNGVVLNNCTNVQVKNCSISKISQKGIKVTGGNNCKVMGNSIYETGTGGISVSGGNHISLSPSNNYITNNAITRYSYLQKSYGAAIEVGGVGNKILHNEISDGTHLAISFGGNDNIIEYNEIYDVLKEADDAGAIYAGKNKIKRGNVIRNNYIHDLTSQNASKGIYGVYLDDLFDGTTIEQNIYENISGSGVFVNGGRDNTVINNMFINCCSTVRLTSIGKNPDYKYTIDRLLAQYSGLNDGLYKTDPYLKYNNLVKILEDDPLAAKYNIIKNNVGYKVAGDIAINELKSPDITEEMVRAQNEVSASYLTNTAPGFEDEANKNYGVNSNSIIYQSIPSFIPPDFKNIGLVY